jgi:hypothetical protein
MCGAVYPLLQHLTLLRRCCRLQVCGALLLAVVAQAARASWCLCSPSPSFAEERQLKFDTQPRAVRADVLPAPLLLLLLLHDSKWRRGEFDTT